MHTLKLPNSLTEKDDFKEYVDDVDFGCSQESVSQLRAVIAKKPWVGFDLDDTLHDFRGASTVAITKPLNAISQRHGTPLPALQSQYSKILTEKTSHAFSDGKTSHEYRRERFTTLLTHFSLPIDESFLAQLLGVYEITLTESLQLKSGALSLLSTIRKMCKKVVVITEGPQDAQERTVRELGIAGQIDFLATTNHFGVAKTDGLFKKVLEHLGISSADMLYVGDSEERDMKCAMAEGIFCIHFTEGKGVALDAYPPRVDTLRELENIFLG